MKKFNIKVNGTPYEVEVEEVPEHSTEVLQPVKEVKEAAPKASAPKMENSIPGGNKSIVASMPGTILKVNVSIGDAVRKGQILLILEAMKMENEIASPADGTVSSIMVEKGKAVNAGDILVSLV